MDRFKFDLSRRDFIRQTALAIGGIALFGLDACAKPKPLSSSTTPASPASTASSPMTTTTVPLSSSAALPSTTLQPSTTLPSSTIPPPSTTQPPSATSPSPTTSPPPTTQAAPVIPAEYQSLYSQLQGYISADNQQISAMWNGAGYAVGYAAELLTADANAGPGILQSNTQQVMLEELDGERSLGLSAITVQIGYPIFEPAFYMTAGQSAAQAQQSVQTWLGYYQSVAQAIHSRGLKMIVESNPLLTYYIDSQSSFNPGNYYNSIDFATYKARRSAHNVIVAQQIKPDYLLLQTEPDTDAVNDFRTELDDATQDVAMIAGFVQDLESAIPGLHASILLGSGAGAWKTNWQAYISGLAAIPGLDKLDTHIYNLQPGINQVGEIAVAMQVADMAHAAGKGVSISELWAHKSVVLAGFTGSDPLADVRARDLFSFWSPLDEQFFQMVAKLGSYKQFDYISAFGFYNWFTLVDYSSLPTPPVYPAANSTQNTAVDAQIMTMQNQAAKLALAGQQLSPTGKAYQSIVTKPVPV